MLTGRLHVRSITSYMHNCSDCAACRLGIDYRGLPKYHREVQPIHHTHDSPQCNRKYSQSNSPRATIRVLKFTHGYWTGRGHLFHIQLHSNVHLFHSEIMVLIQKVQDKKC